MALPKSMRCLAGVTVCLFVVVFVLLLKPSGVESEMQLPSTPPTKKLGDWDHDPQLDRTVAFARARRSRTVLTTTQHPANPPSPCGESTATTTLQTGRTARASMLRY